MSTECTTEPQVKPAIRSDIVASLTPVEIAAGVIRLLGEAQAVNPGITVINLYVHQYAPERAPSVDWRGHGVNNACDIGKATFASLVKSLDRQIGPSAETAARLRDEAARLLAEANQLEAATSEKEAAK
jgi:hypothetical protein